MSLEGWPGKLQLQCRDASESDGTTVDVLASVACSNTRVI